MNRVDGDSISRTVCENAPKNSSDSPKVGSRREDRYRRTSRKFLHAHGLVRTNDGYSYGAKMESPSETHLNPQQQDSACYNSTQKIQKDSPPSYHNGERYVPIPEKPPRTSFFPVVPQTKWPPHETNSKANTQPLTCAEATAMACLMMCVDF